MQDGAVYNETTEPQAKPTHCPFGCTLRRLSGWQLGAKAFQAILSFLAFICEEIVEGCIKCAGLYIFEFISCSALLLSLLTLCVYCTDIYERFGKNKVQIANLLTIAVTGVCFLLASIVFAVTSSGSSLENAACIFGFLASFAFLAESIIEYFPNRKQNIDGCSENPGNTQTTTEHQPLNTHC
ncbi:CKLF-like MARVEL transmembrane domain-containing protein 6 isoform X2 [Phalacrocorax aristotelis]|uniref:CKLF-like MARVEL transmembrane domain-containing protein 6 isoform X2 n=1 Tax=Phalacrocorax aristotelis TaxID=126867 RepID=UPI003F4B50E5